MRVRQVLAARRLLGGLLLPLVLALVACTTSPSEQLLHAEKLLSNLETKGAEQYLTFEIAELRRGIEEAKKDIRRNRIETASNMLGNICRQLDSCGVLLVKLKSDAETRSRQQMVFLGAQLRTLESALERLPKLTYVDQNRYDIHMHRLRRYHKDLESMEALIASENFPEALEKGSTIQLQVAKVFSGLTDVSAEIALMQRRQEKNGSKTAEQQPRLAGVLSVTAQ